MIYVTGAAITALAFVAMYCAAVSRTRWFQISIYTAISLVLAVLVTSNLYR